MDSFGEKFGIGQPVRRKEDQRLLKGGGKYTDDINVAGQTHLALIRATHAHARIKGIDASAALAAPGVIAVYTGKDMDADGVGRVVTDAQLKNLAGEVMFRTERLALPTDKVRYGGEPVAIVVAETAFQARDAAELVMIDYEELPALVTPLQAVAEGAGAIHD